MYHAYKLASGETMTIDDEGLYAPKPYQVQCIDSDGKTVRWCKDFVTLEEAETEVAAASHSS
jgi:hypothetical protein